MQQLANLTRQTLIHLQDRFDPARRIPSAAVFKAERPKEAPAPVPKKVAHPPAPKKVETPAPLLDQPKREEKKQDHSELREQISDLLPHMRLLEKPLERGPVALICFYDDELAFYKALAGAIHKNLAPVKLLSGKGTLPFFRPLSSGDRTREGSSAVEWPSHRHLCRQCLRRKPRRKKRALGPAVPETKALNRVARVALDAGIPKPLDYSIPEDKASGVVAGMRVLVTLRGKQVRGTVLSLKSEGEVKKLHPIDELLASEPALTPDLLELALWISEYYAAPLGKVMKSFLPAPVRKESKPKTQLFLKSLLSLPKLRTLCSELRSRSTAQAAILDLLLKSPSGMLLSEALRQSNASRASVTALEKIKAVTVKSVTIDRMHLANQEFFRTQPKVLTEEQSVALKKITDSLAGNTFAPHLIHGVTGSGKTEIYMQAIAAALAQKKGAIYLVPEIALTSQTIERLKGRFEECIAILHYRLSEGERLDAWHKIRKGQAPIVIGARSAIFSPISNLGLIIVDEEHESSYKQSEESPKYNGRDVAIMRAKFANATVLLGSATPSVESYTNALKGKYTLSILKERATDAKLPAIHVVDMQREFARNGGYTLFSEALIDGMKKRIELGEQTLLFLNRRGYHTSAQCPSCAEPIKCPHCEISLTYHKRGDILSCHLCDHQVRPPRHCPHCSHEGDFKFKGAGTEMIERSLHALLPSVRTLRLDADTTKQKGSHEAIFKEFRSGKADILIGTQMIAKGLHFPQVTLVGVINTDGSLNIPDFRASETVFQLLTQVAGRAGRSELPGEVIIQTHMPDHPIITLASEGNYDDFYKEEIETRILFNFPPHTHLIKCTFAALDERQCQTRAGKLRKAIINILPASAEILPLVPCGYAKIKSMYRYQCLIKCKNPAAIAGQIKSLFDGEQGTAFKCGIDVDPTSTFF